MKCTFVVEHDVGSVRLPSPFLDVVVDSKLIPATTVLTLIEIAGN